MKLYISGAITGTTDYMDRFCNAQKMLEEQGHTVINPAKVNLILPEETTTYEQYMNVCMVLLDMADGIYMIPGWEKSCGANRELGYALAKDKFVIYE